MPQFWPNIEAPTAANYVGLAFRTGHSRILFPVR